MDDPDDQTRHLVGIAVDVTEQRGLEERTKKADARLRDAIEAISGSLRALGRRQPPRALQLEIPEPARPPAGRRRCRAPAMPT